MTHAAIHVVPLNREGLARRNQDPDDFARSHELRLGVVRAATIAVAEQFGRFDGDAGVEAPWRAYLGRPGVIASSCTTCPCHRGDVVAQATARVGVIASRRRP